MSERDLLREWQNAMQSVASSIGAAARRPEDIAQKVLAPMQRQAELFQEVLDRERALQAGIVRRAFRPLDAVFDLLEESGSALRSQAEAIEEAARALEQAAVLMKLQADLFARTIKTLREPAHAVKSLAGLEAPREPPTK